MRQERKSFYLKLLSLAVPITIQHLIVSGFHMVDGIMIGQLGEVPIAGVGLANQIFFIQILILFGISSGAAVFTAQYWGKKSLKDIRQTAFIALCAALFISLVFTLACSLFPRFLISLYSSDPAVIEAGSSYLRIVCLGFPLMALSTTIAVLLHSMENVVIPLIINSISLALNTFFNWCLIFGKLGFPEMGVQGAALATATTRLLEFLLIIIILRSRKNPLMTSLKEYFSATRDTVLRVMKKSLPVVLNEAIWGVGVTIYNGIYARMSTQTMASYQISATVMDLFFVAIIGMGNACATMVGNRIGAGEKDKAYRFARRFLLLSLILGAILGVLVFFTAGPITRLFNVSDSVRSVSRSVLWVFCLFLVFKSSTLHLVVGIFRSGGDARVGMLMDLVGVWFIGIPLAMLGAFVFKWPLPLVYALVCIEEVFKLVYGIIRFRSRKWINDLTQLPQVEPVVY